MKDDGKPGIMIGPKDGPCVVVRENDDGQPEVNVATKIRDGQPLSPGSQLMAVEVGDDGPIRGVRLHDIGHAGPARVTSNDYRNGWDRIRWN